MKINRVAVQQIIDAVPTKLRNAARAERKVIITESKKDPIGTSIRTTHGQFNFSNNLKLQKQIKKISANIAAAEYKSAETKSFIQRQPFNISLASDNRSNVVHASMIF